MKTFVSFLDPGQKADLYIDPTDLIEVATDCRSTLILNSLWQWNMGIKEDFDVLHKTPEMYDI